jgi:hypothetical protein
MSIIWLVADATDSSKESHVASRSHGLKFIIIVIKIIKDTLMKNSHTLYGTVLYRSIRVSCYIATASRLLLSWLLNSQYSHDPPHGP